MSIANEEQEFQLIQDWIAFLRAKATLLNPQAEQDAFERSSQDTAHAEAQADLAALSAERRRLFERAFAERCAAWQTTQEHKQAQTGISFIDPQQIEQSALNECVQLAEGQGHPDGPDYVRYPALPTEPITWHDAYLPQLRAAPTDAAYRLSSRYTGRRDRLLRIAAGILLVPACALLLWTLFAPDSPPVRAAQDTDQSQTLTRWPVLRAVLSGSEQPVELVVTVSEQPWPADGKAHWSGTAHLPEQICLPESALASAQQLRLIGDGSVPDRFYALADPADPQADLLVLICGKTAPVRSARLSELLPQPAASLGEPIQLDQNLTLRLDQVQVYAADQDTAIPAESMQLVLRLTAVTTETAAIDWASYAPTLRLSDGTIQSAPQISADGTTAQLSYLLPKARSTRLADFRLTNPEGEIRRWRLELHPPPDRATVLGDALQIETITADSNSVQLKLTNRSSLPLSVQQSDFVVTQEEVPFALNPITGLESALAAGETRSYSITLPNAAAGRLILSLGTYRFEINR